MIPKEDLELLLLRGKSINISIGKIYPLTLNEISELGYSQYNQYISLLLVDKNNLQEKNNGLNLNKITNFDIVFQSCLLDEQFKQSYIDMLSLFFKETIQLGNSFFYLGELVKNDNNEITLNDNRIIYKENFDDIVNTLKRVNCLKVNPNINEMDAFDRRIAQAEKKISELNNTNDNLTFSNLISSICNMSDNGIDIFNVWNLTIYQLYDQFNRGQLKEKYIINIKSIFAGSKPEDIDLTHYIKNINKE